MSTLQKALPLLLFLVAAFRVDPLAAQQGTPYDCGGSPFTWTASTSTTIVNTSNASACRSWAITFSSTSTLNSTLTFSTSPDNSSFTNVANTQCTGATQQNCWIDGANPLPGTSNGTASFRVYAAYVRVSIVVNSGSGTGTVKVYGYKGLSANAGGGSGGGGGSVANGVACTQNPYTNGGGSGTKTCTHNLNSTTPAMMILSCQDINGTSVVSVGGPVYVDPNNWTFTLSVAPTNNMDCFASTGGRGGQGPAGPIGPPHSCTIAIGDPGAASPVLVDDNDSPSVCGNMTGADLTITAVACWANAGTPTVTPILTGGSGTSILTGALPCGTGSWAAGTVNGSPVIHSFTGAATCSSTPCTIDDNITVAGGVARYLLIQVRF